MMSFDQFRHVGSNRSMATKNYDQKVVDITFGKSSFTSTGRLISETHFLANALIHLYFY